MIARYHLLCNPVITGQSQLAKLVLARPLAMWDRVQAPLEKNIIIKQLPDGYRTKSRKPVPGDLRRGLEVSRADPVIMYWLHT